MKQPKRLTRSKDACSEDAVYSENACVGVESSMHGWYTASINTA